MTLAMTPQQRRAFDEDGFIILENLLTAAESNRLAAAADEVVARIQREKGLPRETHLRPRDDRS